MLEVPGSPTPPDKPNTNNTPSERPTTAQSAHSVLSDVSPYDGSFSSVSSTRQFKQVASVGQVSHIFLFVNPTSGGNAAGAFTQAGLAKVSLTNPNIEVHVADIRDGPSGAKPGFLALKNHLEQRDASDSGAEETIIVVMCGGDGTVLWGIMELWEHQIPCDNVIVTVIPYGTGNDFAKALGWDALNALNPFSNDMLSFKSLINEWLNSPVIYHDIWDCEFELYEDGEFQKIDSKSRKKVVLRDEDGTISLILSKKLTNYFSVGIESRIGIGFDRHRKASSLRNKLVYMNEGMKKAIFHRGVRIHEIVKELRVGNEIVFDTDLDNKDHNHLRSCGSIIASNIPSFASGLDIWKNSKRVGLLRPSGARISETSDEGKGLLHKKQLMGDGKLEWLTFGGVTALGTEQVMEGFGRRIHQSGGPFELWFKDTLGSAQRVYFQVDGEFFQMTRPKCVKISFFKKVTCLARHSSKNVQNTE